MQLGRQVEWTIHCCVTLAALPRSEFLSTRELAELYGLPKEYLSKAMQALSRARLLDKAMGPTGGYRLARPDSDINVLDIMEAIEGRAPLFAGTGLGRRSNERSDEGPDCPLNQVMMRADEAWRKVMREVTIKDLRLSAENKGQGS